jgi:hypothetical protein
MVALGGLLSLAGRLWRERKPRTTGDPVEAYI